MFPPAGLIYKSDINHFLSHSPIKIISETLYWLSWKQKSPVTGGSQLWLTCSFLHLEADSLTWAQVPALAPKWGEGWGKQLGSPHRPRELDPNSSALLFQRHNRNLWRFLFYWSFHLLLFKDILWECGPPSIWTVSQAVTKAPFRAALGKRGDTRSTGLESYSVFPRKDLSPRATEGSEPREQRPAGAQRNKGPVGPGYTPQGTKITRLCPLPPFPSRIFLPASLKRPYLCLSWKFCKTQKCDLNGEWEAWGPPIRCADFTVRVTQQANRPFTWWKLSFISMGHILETQHSILFNDGLVPVARCGLAYALPSWNKQKNNH